MFHVSIVELVIEEDQDEDEECTDCSEVDPIEARCYVFKEVEDDAQYNVDEEGEPCQKIAEDFRIYLQSNQKVGSGFSLLRLILLKIQNDEVLK